MRISTFEIHRHAASQLQALGAEVSRTQQQISSGKRIVDPSDDPVGAARAIELKQAIGVREQYLDNANAADNALSLEDTILAQITSVIHRVQELTIQSGSGVQTAADRQFLSSEIESRFEELVSLVNTRGADGQYVFAGFKSDTPPFEVNGDNVTYNGDHGQRQIQIDQGQMVKLNDSGGRLFMQVDSIKVNASAINYLVEPENANASAVGVNVVDQDLVDAFHPDKLVVEFRPLAEGGGVPNYTVIRQSDQRPVDGLVNIPFASGAPILSQGIAFKVSGEPTVGDRFVIETNQHQGLLNTVRQIASGLNNVDAIAQPDEFRSLIDDTIDGLNSALENVLEVRAELGARLNTTDAAKNLHQDLALQLQEMLSSVEDLDFAEAVSSLSYQSFILEAAQKSFVRINGLSLFNFLR
jgi:flagellar hook-associated protein 3 FlgL